MLTDLKTIGCKRLLLQLALTNLNTVWMRNGKQWQQFNLHQT
ncbi:hypothetical protein VL20_6404 [Microcystis panniformis FACHB-1757]|uniref:Uncharacterized protein n=1 Tax=Microcystis panniformis FACHB-1757 TaxID=1638788 RepID=A0A0K1SAS7_9CHRO|nr:hypothetical protein VL20_6404 [Microcystis panniformis FACHB-1757]